MKIGTPTDYAALSIIGIPENAHCLEDGDNFLSDGYIYSKEGIRKQKWFVKFQSPQYPGIEMRLWEPKIKNLKKLEKTRWKIVEYVNKKIRPDYFAAFDKMAEVKIAHIYMQKSKDSAEGWRRYEYDNGGLGFDWLKEEPKEILNQEIAKNWIFHNKRFSWFMRYLKTTEDLLQESFRIMKMPKPKTDGTNLRIIVNGRSYPFYSKYNNWGVLRWELMHFPNQNEIIINLDK